MNKNIVRIQAEVIKPGILVRGGMVHIYLDPPSNFVWWPYKPKYTMLDDMVDPKALSGSKVMRFDEGGVFLRFDALGAEYDGSFAGDIDWLLSYLPAEKLFQDDLANLALMTQQTIEVFSAQPKWVGLAVYSVDAAKEQVKFEAMLELNEKEAAS